MDDSDTSVGHDRNKVTNRDAPMPSNTANNTTCNADEYSFYQKLEQDIIHLWPQYSYANQSPWYVQLPTHT